MVEASVIVMRCVQTKKLAGIRVQKMADGDWYRTWAFPLRETTAKHEGYDQTRVHGSLQTTNGYPGCPHCGNRGFYICFHCEQVVCWNGKDPNAVCPWCGATSSITIADSFDVSTNRF